MDSDDIPVGRILGRREMLALLGASGAVLLVARGLHVANASDAQVPNAQAATATPALNQRLYLPAVSQPEAATPTLTATPTDIPTPTPTMTSTPTSVATSVPACVVRPELTEGPFFEDFKLNRADIRANTADATNNPGGVSQGVIFDLTFRISHVSNNACVAYHGVYVDVWHADAYGAYSGETSMGINTPGENFLRGYQITDANGLATFRTIYPGWYTSRAVHLHFKVRTSLSTNTSGVFTPQFFFDDALTTQIYAANAPYNARSTRDTLNSGDNIYAQSAGQTLLTVSQTSAGYSALFDLGVSL